MMLKKISRQQKCVQNYPVGKDLDSNCWISLMVFLKEFFVKVDVEKKSADNKNVWKITQ